MGDWDSFVLKYNDLVEYVKSRYPTIETNVEKTLEVNEMVIMFYFLKHEKNINL